MVDYICKYGRADRRKGRTMSEYIGNIGDKVELDVKLVGRHEYHTHFTYRGETNYIYTMEDANGNILVWKTTSLLDVTIKNGEDLDFIRVGDLLRIKGTVKEHSEYKGDKQTALARCKYSLIEHAQDPIEAKREAQKASLADGDFIWEMPYKQYKEHYSDCETLAYSFNKEEGTIKVIIRHGRLKPSGVRGQHFSSYCFSDGKSFIYFRAVCEDTARKQLIKKYPDRADWECVKILR